MNDKPREVRIIKTGEIKVVKPWGFGYIDAKGDLYHRNEFEFLRMLE